MRTHSSLELGSLRGTTPELLVSPWHRAWGFCVREEGLPHKTDSPPINAGTAEPVRVSPPEAVAYPLELSPRLLIPNRRSFPPVECWRGTSPSQAAHCRPFLNVLASLTAATRAVALRGPIPGIVISR